ncbi:MAG: alpha-amylase family glycosyl hydrolase [Gaiellaceae bacterium]
MRATYRLQLTPAFGFKQALELVPYLRDLGVSHLYLSPSLQATSGSQHGYDVVDPRRISEELGGEEAFRELCSAGLKVVLDIVPNHMAISNEPPFWTDLDLRLKFFDVDLRTGFHRRFFDVDSLGGLRIEDPDVFETTHGKALELVAEGLVDGLRIDHPDGLANPREYLDRLARAGVERVWVEKILEPGEELRDWPVQGTTGYEFANDVTALFVDPAGEEPLTGLYAELTGETRPFREVADEAKLEVALATFEPELRRLHEELDVPNLAEALASFPVYRTYVEPEEGIVGDADREAIGAAHLSDTLERILLLDEPGHGDFVTRFQTSGAVMAKGVEDTAFYRYLRLTALNEVGGDPGRFSLPVDEFHSANTIRADRFPLHLLASQTHDTKRSGDVRARIVALAGMAAEWRERVLAWRELTGGLPDSNEEYLVYQTLVGAWPIEPERLDLYLEKALREAKVNTSWIKPDEQHEAEVKEFARRLCGDRAFLADFEPFATRVAEVGHRISLAQTLLKLTCPGVGDIYQGDELEALALVDPDNRMPVDWKRRRRALAELREGTAPTRETAKLYVVWKTLELRGRREEAFLGGYEPLEGPPEVCAFTRDNKVLVAVHLRGGDAPVWDEPWQDALDGAELGVTLMERRDA